MSKNREVEPEAVCAATGCNKKPSTKGLCSGHYHRLRRYGDPLGAPDRGETAADILVPVIGERLAAAVIECRQARDRAKPFDAYRARITLKMFQRASMPRLSAWEYINRDANRRDLTQEYVRACVSYDAETGLFVARLPSASRQEGDILGALGNHGYLTIAIAGKSYLAHRLAWFYVHGRWPILVDHIDRDRHNNRLCNLRECTYRENAWNVTPMQGTASGVEGVNWFASRRKWVAKISSGGVYRTLGYFDTIEEAAAVRAQAVKVERGHFLRSEGAAA